MTTKKKRFFFFRMVVSVNVIMPFRISYTYHPNKKMLPMDNCQWVFLANAAKYHIQRAKVNTVQSH